MKHTTNSQTIAPPNSNPPNPQPQQNSDNHLDSKTLKNNLLILGGVPLKGVIRISPAKNAILPLIAATLVTKDPITLPYTDILDAKSKLKILEAIGYQIVFKEDEVDIIPTEKICSTLPSEMVKAIRSSILFFGPLLALHKKISINLPGGDDLKRKHNFHLECLEKMGAKIRIEGDMIHGELDGNFKSTEYTFARPSVGATQHMILTAILGEKGNTIILNNCAQEPECEFLINVLRDQLGAKIEVIGTRIVINGNGGRLSTGMVQKHKIKVPQDRIEALTYLALSLATDGEIILDMNNPLDILGNKDLSLLLKIGGKLNIDNNFLSIKRTGPLQAVKYFESGEYPYISTDFAPIFCSLLGISKGTSIFTETIYDSHRFKYIEELNKFGGVFRSHYQKPHTILIDGSSYFPSEGSCHDIRGGMALLIAALSAKGCSTLYNSYHIFRGYQFLIERINSLGGNLKLI